MPALRHYCAAVMSDTIMHVALFSADDAILLVCSTCNGVASSYNMAIRRGSARGQARAVF